LTTKRSLSEAAVFPTAVGWMAAAWRNAQLYSLSFGLVSTKQALRALPEGCGSEFVQCFESGSSDVDSPHDLLRRLQAYARGEPDEFKDVPVYLDDRTAFQQRVLRACRDIGYGKTTTYAQLARRAGSPQAARAVGNVMASNRVPLVIPCHRVVGSAGALGGFSARGGVGTKRKLLQLERAPELSSEGS
jgi:methylated-DNA-[protein]-cysteine S-methyltransferase